MPPILCQICKKNVATVQLTEIIKDKKREMHLCEQCAHRKGLPVKSGPVPGKPGVLGRLWPRKKSDKE